MGDYGDPASIFSHLKVTKATRIVKNFPRYLRVVYVCFVAH